MRHAPIPENESSRLAELERYSSVAAALEAPFNQITKLSSRVFHCPIAVLTFVTQDGQSLKSRFGENLNEGTRTDSFCAWAILSDQVLVVPDARNDSRFVDNCWVTGKAGVRFYAGAPLLSPRGYRLGTLCVADTEPRPQGLSPEEVEDLTSLAALVMESLESRLAAQDAEEVQDILRTTLGSIGDGVIVTDARAHITFMNRVAEQLTGWQQEEGLAKPLEQVFNVVDEVSRKPLRAPLVPALETGSVVGLANHTILLAKDGREIPIDDSGAPVLRNGIIIGGVLVFRDVTKRRETERALEASENQYRTTFANAPLGLVLAELSGQFIQSNEAYRRLIGYTHEELSRITFISRTHPAEIDNNRQLFKRLVNEEIESYVLEKRIFNKENELRWVRAHAALLRNADGTATKVIGLVEDVTDRKQSELRFRFLADSIPQMVWTATPDGMLDYINAEGLRYFETSTDQVLGSQWLNWVHPDDHGLAVRSWTEALATGTPYETEFRLKSGSTGDWRLHLVRARAFLGDSGKVAQWFGTCTDIEDRRRVATQIDEDRRRWRELLLQTPAAIAVLRGPHHTVDCVNLDFETLVGRSAEMLVGRPVLEALPEIATQIYADLLDRVYELGELFRGHEVSVRLGPSQRLRDLYVDFVCLPTRNAEGTTDGIFAHITDVTGKVAARRAIEDSETQFRTLAETIPHLTWMADATGHIFWYNHRWYDFTGTTLEEMKGWGWQKVHDPRMLADVTEKWQKALESGEPFEMIFPLRRADGVFRSFLTRVEAIRDRHGKVVRWFGTNTDITDQRRTEEQLRRMNRDLEEFAYVTSHDLQEPLRMVNIYTQLLLKGNRSEHDLKTFAAFITQGVQRMETLIQDLLKFSRSVHTDEQPIGTADLSAAFAEAVNVLESRISELAAVITISELPQTTGDTRQIAHVFQNILSNALKYRKPTIKPEIEVNSRREDDKWIVSIRDNGIGFQPQYAEQIFGLFKRLHKDEYEGTGLGLAICKRIVERYGGRMWAESAYGHGSTFHFSLPAVSEL